VEVDHHGALVPDMDVRLASLAPDGVVLMTSFAKELHPDLRVASISGPSRILNRISVWRAGGAWIRAVDRARLEVCLADPDVRSGVTRARREYERRREIFIDAFAKKRIEISSNAGIGL